MTSSSKGINFDNKHISSPLTTLFRKASTHRPGGGSTFQTPTQPQSPLIHTRFRGSVATASSYDTSGFQDEESVIVDVRASNSAVRTFLLCSLHLVHFAQHPDRPQTPTKPSNFPRTKHQLSQSAELENHSHPSGSIPVIAIYPSPDDGVSIIACNACPQSADLVNISVHPHKK
jgi:hypothetical protein